MYCQVLSANVDNTGYAFLNEEAWQLRRIRARLLRTVLIGLHRNMA